MPRSFSRFAQAHPWVVLAMDVVYFSPLLRTGGTQRHLFELCRALDPERFRLSVCCLNGGGVMQGLFADAGIRVRDLGVGRKFFSPSSAVALKRTVSWLRQLRPDVVHAYQCRPSIFATIAARLAGVPAIIVSKRSFDRQGWLLENLWRRTNRLASILLVNSEALAHEARSEAGADKVVMIPCGVDPEEFRPQDRAAAKRLFRLSLDAPLVGSVGRLIGRKGHRYLLEAAAEICRHGRGVEVMLVGDGPEKSALQARAEELGMARRVHFLGDRADVRECLAAMDVFVLPSLHEGMSNALLEGMAMAKPVVVSDGPGNPEVVRDGVSGVIVKAGDTAELVAAIDSLIADRSLARRLGQNARQQVVAEFSRKAMVKRFEDLYETLVTKKRRRLQSEMVTQEHLA